MRPVAVQEVLEEVHTTLSDPSITVYPEIAAPPFEVGAVQEMDILDDEPLGVAEMLVGADGTVLGVEEELDVSEAPEAL